MPPYFLFSKGYRIMGNAPGRVMGIDFGTRHIGVAVSDELRVIARGIETVNWNGEDPEWALNRICEIIKEMDVKAIVLGRPARTDGTRSETQDKAEAFGKSLADRCGIEPVFKDERYTTVLASRYLHESNIKAKKQKKVIDQVAAEIILQDYLNTL
jgi:putative Holliday junction resolvase